MSRKMIFKIYLLGFSLLQTMPKHVFGGPTFSNDMLNAKTIDEFLAAKKSVESDHRGVKPSESSSRSLEGGDEYGPILANEFGGTPGFYHGVASGDMLSDAVVIWTRYTPESKDDKVELEYRIAEVSNDLTVEDHLDTSKNPNIKYGRTTVTPDSDWVLKMDITGLQSGTNYVFAFTDGSMSSPVGQTTTAPADDDEVEEMTYAVFSCAHFTNGYFHAYDVASTIENLDFWIHLGDYIYEYGDYSLYGIDAKERLAMLDPKCETSELSHYRRRYALHVAYDEGSQNLRRRAPMIAVWDDHEFANDAYGNGNVDDTGSANHQEVCTADITSPNEEKNAAKCDRDEGPVDVRFNNAAKAYFEWMPLRDTPGNMGVIKGNSLKRTVEWGDMATIVTFDTRISTRSKEPSIEYNVVEEFGYAFIQPNITAYNDPESAISQTFASISQGVVAKMNNESYTMAGPDQVEYLKNAFKSSKKAGKPWQILGTQTVMSPLILLNLNEMYKSAKSQQAQATIKAYMDAILPSETGGLYRAFCAMEYNHVPFNRDSYDGYAFERSQILEICEDDANNAIVLGGDSHDAWGFKLFERGQLEGKTVAVNLGVPGVTNPSPFREEFSQLLALFEPVLGKDGFETLISDMFKAANPGLVHNEVFRNGFFAVKATKETHTAEFFLFEPEVLLSNYTSARDLSGGITAEPFCDVSLVTHADQKGSLEVQESCGAITFSGERPAEWTSIPVPAVLTTEQNSGGAEKRKEIGIASSLAIIGLAIIMA